MAEPTTPAVTPTAPPPAGQPTQAPAEGFKLPEKFQGKGIEDVAKAYVELERVHGETSSKLKEYDSYKSLGDPKTLQEVVNWARDKYAKIEKGELIERAQAARPPATPAQPAGAPWEEPGWEFKNQADQASALANYVKSEAMNVIAQKEAAYNQQLSQYNALQGNQQQILLDAIQGAISSGVPVNEILTQAAALAAKQPKDLIQTVLESRQSPEKQKAEVERLVNERMAELKQKSDNEQLALLNRATSPTPRFRSSSKKSEEINRDIVSKLKKNGIDLLA